MKRIAFGIIATILILGCSNQDNTEQAKRSYNELEIFAEESIQDSDKSLIPDQSAPAEIIPDRKVIKNGYLTIKSEDINRSRFLIDSISKRFKCYISSENYNESSISWNYDYTIRIQAGEFDNFLAAIAAGPDLIMNKSVNLSDVTDQFYDLSTRLENNKAVELRYRELLNKATAVKDILEIERSLGEIRGEIETQQGRLNRMESEIAFSTLNINLFQEKSIKETTVARDSFSKRVGRSIARGWDGFVSFVIVVLTIWPFWILVIVIWRLVVYFTRKKVGK